MGREKSIRSSGSSGVMAGHQAKKQNLGGELLLTVY